MKLLTATQTRTLDSATVQAQDIAYLELMERVVRLTADGVATRIQHIVLPVQRPWQ